jgi:hypothetical protein
LHERVSLSIGCISAPQSSTGSLSIKMHDKLAALLALGKHLGMFVQRTQNTNIHYIISDQPMTQDEWVKRYVTPH